MSGSDLVAIRHALATIATLTQRIDALDTVIQGLVDDLNRADADIAELKRAAGQARRPAKGERAPG